MCRIACPASAGSEGTKSMTKNKPAEHGRGELRGLVFFVLGRLEAYTFTIFLFQLLLFNRF